jgi:hypothetical protein
VSDECIHGFAIGLCAICYPKAAPEPARAIRPTKRTRVISTTTTRNSSPQTRRGPSPAIPPASVLDQRIYHVTHHRNLPGILSVGGLVAGATPTVDIAATELRAERSATPAPGFAGRSVAEYVPFFLSPQARLWQAIREQRPHPRLEPGVAVVAPADFVFLVSTVRQVIDRGLELVVADGNAEGSSTRFAATREEAERMLGRLRADESGTSMLEAEFLVFGELPIELIGLIGVANDKVRSAVRELLAAQDYLPKVSVYPPWFQRAG